MTYNVFGGTLNLTQSVSLCTRTSLTAHLSPQLSSEHPVLHPATWLLSGEKIVCWLLWSATVL